MDAPVDVKKLPRWAWLVAIGGGLLVGYFILRRSGGSGEAAAGTQEGAPMVPPTMDNAAAGGGVAGGTPPQTLPGGGGTDSLNPLNTVEVGGDKQAAVTLGGNVGGTDTFPAPMERTTIGDMTIGGGTPTPNVTGGNVNYYGGVLAPPDEPATPLIMVTPPPAPVPQYVQPALERYGGVRLPEPV